MRSNSIDITGKKFNRWLCLGPMKYRGENQLWQCRCDCGVIKWLLKQSIKEGRSKSCGCLHREIMKQSASTWLTKHGMAGSKTYNSWVGLMGRCFNKNKETYKYYGGRGITVCKRWLIFANFFKDMGVRPIGKTLDRINTNGNYSPANCRWSTHKEQTQNTRRNRKITFNGRTECISEWARILGMKRRTLGMRIDFYQWPLERAMTP